MEAYNLPITIRRWFLQRLAQQIEKENEQYEEASKKSKSGRRLCLPVFLRAETIYIEGDYR